MSFVVAREVQYQFWRLLRERSVEDAAAVVGVTDSTAKRWMRERGGVSPAPNCRTDRYLSFDERQEIQELASKGLSNVKIATAIGRHPATISRELRRGARLKKAGDGHLSPLPYLASVAQARRDRAAARPKATKLSRSPQLAKVIAEKMSGPQLYSPQQVSGWLKRKYPHSEAMRISHETLYQELYVQGRGTLRKELTACLRTGRAARKPRTVARRPRVPGELLIGNRPEDVDGRVIPGHWEGDLILGKGNLSGVGTLVERRTRFVILLCLTQGHAAEQVADQIAAQMAHLPEHLRRSLTWDQGNELVGSHERVAAENGLTVWFCDPHSPWQRGTNENTNGLLRQYLPKGTDLSGYTQSDLDQIAAGLNSRPRKTLEYATPAEVMTELLSTTTE